LIIFRVVDFPDPEVPISTENAPSAKFRFRWLAAGRPAKVLLTS
jgi:hypothetical protein